MLEDGKYRTITEIAAVEGMDRGQPDWRWNT